MAKDMGALVIGMVSYLFPVKRARFSKADEGLDTIRHAADLVILLDHNKPDRYMICSLFPPNPFSEMNQRIADTIRVISKTI